MVSFVPCTQYSSHFAFRVLLPSALHPVLPSANYSPSRRRRPKLSSFPLRPPPTPANHHAFPPFSFADSPIFFLPLFFFAKQTRRKIATFVVPAGRKRVPWTTIVRKLIRGEESLLETDGRSIDGLLIKTYFNRLWRTNAAWQPRLDAIDEFYYCSQLTYNSKDVADY